jgi:hypothetical protein
MSEIRSFAGTAAGIVTCDDHASYAGVPYASQVKYVLHIFREVGYVQVYFDDGAEHCFIPI